MMQALLKKTVLALLFALPLSAKLLISPIDAMHYTYGEDTKVVKKNILLSKAQAAAIEKQASVQLTSKIFRIYRAIKNGKIVGYGILINKKVRSKNGVVLYFISPESKLLGIEIIAFNEPIEYLPSKQWNSQFQNIQTDKLLRVSKEIATITGATLSARSVTDGSRIAFGIYNTVIKGK